MDTQIKFSDIIRYVLLGGVAIAYFLLVGFTMEIEPITKLLSFTMDNSSDMMVLIVIGFSSFLIGVLLQSVRAMIEYWPRIIVATYNRESAGWWRKKLYHISNFILYGTIFELCHHLKSDRKYSEDMPMWIYLSDDPSATLNFVRGRLSKDLNSESNSLGESFYYHELFMGLEYALLLVPLITMSVWHKDFNFFTTETQTLTITGLLAITAMRVLARLESKKYLRYINSLYDIFEDYSNSHHPYFATRLPIVYVLIRTVEQPQRLHYITRAIESVLHQNYPNKRIIIFEDMPEGKTGSSDNSLSLVTEIEAELHRLHGDKPDYIDNLQKIVTYKRAQTHIDASGTAHDIRETFLNEANSRDIAVLLDDDDYFDRNDALTDIAVKMSATNADIGLLTFRNVSDMGCVLSNGGGKFHNSTVKKIAHQNKSVKYLPEFIFVDTLGWTKVYSYRMMVKYAGSIDKFDRISKLRYKDHPAFEDFPDFICFLFPDTKVCAIDRPTHCYFNRTQSITGCGNLKAFEHRCGFLAYTMAIIEYLSSDQNADKSLKVSKFASDETKRFIIYKIGVICNIIKTKFARGNNGCADNNGYSIAEFMGLCKSQKSSEALRNLLINETELVKDCLTEYIEDKKSLVVGDGIRHEDFINEILKSIKQC